MLPEKRRNISREDLRAGLLKMIRKEIPWQPRLLNAERVIVRPDGKVITVHTTVFPIRTSKSLMIGRITRDVTDKKLAEEQIKNSLREKEILLKEVHHRVKNNMQIISSILNLQANTITDPEATHILKVCESRVRSMAFIHESLYRTGNFAWLDLSDYIEKLIGSLFSTYGLDPEQIAWRSEVSDVRLDLNIAIPCGLIVNELVSNSLKHAFTRGMKGEIVVRMEQSGANYILVVSDTGTGLPPGCEMGNTGSLGLQIVHALVDQLSGSMKIDTEGGTTFTIVFPAQ